MGTKYQVTVPVRTVQTFIVEASSPRGAKTKVQHWFQGIRDEGADLEVLDDIGQRSERIGSRYWKVVEA